MRKPWVAHFVMMIVDQLNRDLLFPVWGTFVQKCGDAFFGVAEQHVLHHHIACIIIGLGHV